MAELDLKAVQFGGPAGAFFAAESLDTPIDFERLAEAGGAMGSGSLYVYGAGRCAVEMARDLTALLHEESCGKCVFCREGTRQLLDILDDVLERGADEEQMALLVELGEAMKNGSICALGRQASAPVLSSLRLFADDYRSHNAGQALPGGDEVTGPETIELLIDGQSVVARAGDSVLDAALEAGIYVPHLCHHPDLPVGGVCRLCVVEVDGVGGVVASCATPAREGMVVRTQSEEITRLRRLALELLLVGHPPECGTCQKYLNCELQSLKQYLGVEELRVKRHPRLLPVTTSNPLFVYEPNKCVLCGRCVRACCELREVGVLRYRERDGEYYIYTSDDRPLAESGCRFCGACAEACPTGAIQDKEELLRDKNRKAALVPCKSNCPAEIDVPRYVRLIREGDRAAAIAVIREKVPFPWVLGYVCDHPCESECRRGEVNQPIAIRELKRFAAEQ